MDILKTVLIIVLTASNAVFIGLYYASQKMLKDKSKQVEKANAKAAKAEIDLNLGKGKIEKAEALLNDIAEESKRGCKGGDYCAVCKHSYHVYHRMKHWSHCICLYGKECGHFERLNIDTFDDPVEVD